MSHASSLKAAPNAARGRSIGMMLILYYQNIVFLSKWADAAFATGVAPDGIVQLAQPAVDLRKTVVVGDQRVLFRIGQEGQTADESGLIVVVEVVVVRQIEVRFRAAWRRHAAKETEGARAPYPRETFRR